MDLPDLVTSYNDTLSSLLNNYAPLKQRSVSVHSRTPWFTPDMFEAKRKRRKLEQKWRVSKSESDHLQYTEQSHLVNEMIKSAKESYFATIIENNKGDQRSLFQSIDHLLNCKAVSRFSTSSSDLELAESFKNFFADKIETIHAAVIAETPFPSLGICSDDTPHKFTHFQPVSPKKMLELISSKVKSCDLDPVPAPVLKPCLSLLTSIEIVNRSLTTGYMPECLKTAQIRPLLKKSNLDPENFKNFRPVSNLPFISKVIKKAVCLQLVNYIETNDLAETFQSAYKSLHSMETALLRVHDDILRAIDNNRSVALLLLDLSAAFDLVDHGILLHRLAFCFGIKGSALSWFQSYLRDGRQYVSVRGESSSFHALHYGVPQGSVLGPNSIFCTPHLWGTL